MVGTAMIDVVERELIYGDGLIRMYWNMKSKSVDIEARGELPHGQYRAAMEKVVDVVRQKRARKILADASDLGKVSNESVLWIETEWIPSVVRAGVKYIALVPPKDLAPYLAIEKMVADTSKSSSGEFTRKFFGDVEDAKKWLTQQ